MLQSTKIKILGYIGTFTIITTAYTLQANAIYKELYTSSTSKSEDKVEEKVVSVVSEVLQEEQLSSKVVKEQPVSIENNTSKEISTLEVNDKNLSTTTAISDDKKVINRSEDEINSTTVSKTEIKPSLTDLNSTDSDIETISELKRVIDDNRYIYADELDHITSKSKEALKKLKPLLAKLDNVYIEIEGYSASKENSDLSHKDSEKIAHIVYSYLRSIGIKNDVVITSYGDNYPIIDNKKDIRNTRAEIKIRRR